MVTGFPITADTTWTAAPAVAETAPPAEPTAAKTAGKRYFVMVDLSVSMLS